MLLFKIFVATMLTVLSDAQFVNNLRCVNPNQRTGTCVSVFDCQTLMSVLQRQPLQQHDVQFVKASECNAGYGRRPHVCCTSDTGFARQQQQQQQPQPNYNYSPRTMLFPADSNNYDLETFETNTRRSNRGRRVDNGRFESTTVTQRTARSTMLPQPPTCGGVTIENKIFGGSDAELYEFPWMVLFEYRRRAGGTSINCAGSIINQRYVLTAAHCITGAIEREIGQLVSIRLGEHDLTSAVDCNQRGCAPESFKVGIEQLIPHENYVDSSKNKENDIGLVRLDRNILFSETMRPICLPSVVPQDQQARVGTKYTVAGWGRTLKTAKSPIKQKLNVALVDQQQCNRKFRERKVEIVNSQLCAGGVFREDSCDGDSGGPLMRFRGDAWVLEGIVSFGVKCGLKNWPGVYTRVASYDQWIRSKIRV